MDYAGRVDRSFRCSHFPKTVCPAGALGAALNVGVAENGDAVPLPGPSKIISAIVIGSSRALFAKNPFPIQPLDEGRLD